MTYKRFMLLDFQDADDAEQAYEHLTEAAGRLGVSVSAAGTPAPVLADPFADLEEEAPHHG